MKKIIIIVLLVAIVLGFLFWKFSPTFFKGASNNQPVTITYWGLWEEDNLIRPVILEYQKQNPKVTINYERKSSINYRTRVQTQIREGVGPDVFRMHNSWLPMFEADLFSAPKEIITLADFKNLFYPVAQESFIKNNQIYAVPMEIDGLALYYNEEILGAIGAKAPQNWQEFIDLAKKMTVQDASGIKTAGAAMGTASNVDHWSDIIGLLMLQQPGADLTNPSNSAAAEVLRFYTGFVTDPRKKTWDVNLPKSTDMFAQGRLGFYFAPSWRAHELRVANPNLKFRVVKVPQLSGKSVGWATFWGEAVSARSQNPVEAWKFVKFLADAKTQKLAYLEASKVRLFGEPYSLKSLAAEIAKDPYAGAFVSQGQYYKTWYLSSNTFDNGINDEMIKYWEDGVNSVLAGQGPESALSTVAQGTKQVLDKYTKPATAIPVQEQ